MHTSYIRPARRDDFPRIAALIDGQNKTPETQCLISGEGYESIHRQMVAYANVSEICFALAVGDDDGRLVGAFGSEFDEELGRGWLWGPFVLAGHLEPLASALFEELLEILPPTVRQLDSFLHAANRQGHRFYLDHGFRKDCLAHVYVADRPETPLALSEPCPAFEHRDAEALIALHDATFPNTYETGPGMIAKIDAAHQVFVWTAGEDVLGYVYATVAEGSTEGCVDFLGVRADARRRGLGRRLLLTAFKWLFEVKQVVRVSLAVYDDQTPARSLYEAAGFRLKHSGWSYRRDLTGLYKISSR